MIQVFKFKNSEKKAIGGDYSLSLTIWWSTNEVIRQQVLKQTQHRIKR